MPKTLNKQLGHEAVKKRLIEWSESVTDRWIADRKGTSEDISKKPFTRDELVNLALVAVQADDLRITEIRSHNGTLPGPDSWSPSDPFWFLLRCLYREFGYVIGFVAFVRESQAPGRGFTVARNSKAGRTKVRALWFDDPEHPGKVVGTEEIAREYLRSPGFVQQLRAKAAEGLAIGSKDVAKLIEKVAPISISGTRVKEALRKK